MKTQNPSMVRQIIPAYPKEQRTISRDEPFMNVAEFFRQTVQGEGVNIGVPSAFLRLQNCTLNCMWCDTEEVWRQGNPYTFTELFDLIEKSGLLDDLKSRHHLILTGGSPLKQQEALFSFLEIFGMRYGFMPYVEIENECTLMPGGIENYIQCWNNSPKLENSGNPRQLRYQPAVLRELSSYRNSWFKFVVEGHEDEWKEIEKDFLNPGYIKHDQVILMPMGGEINELENNRVRVAEMAIRKGVRFTDRLHVTLWNTLTGV